MYQGMTEMISSAYRLIDWFGRWPTFHDHEVLNVQMDGPTGPSILMRIHSWEMTNEADEKGFIKLRKHAIVTLKWKDVKSMFLHDFNVQNVLGGILFREHENGVHTILDASNGMWGEIVAAEVEVIDVEPFESS